MRMSCFFAGYQEEPILVPTAGRVQRHSKVCFDVASSRRLRVVLVVADFVARGRVGREARFRRRRFGLFEQVVRRHDGSRRSRWREEETPR